MAFEDMAEHRSASQHESVTLSCSAGGAYALGSEPHDVARQQEV